MGSLDERVSNILVLSNWILEFPILRGWYDCGTNTTYCQMANGILIMTCLYNRTTGGTLESERESGFRTGGYEK